MNNYEHTKKNNKSALENEEDTEKNNMGNDFLQTKV